MSRRLRERAHPLRRSPCPSAPLQSITVAASRRTPRRSSRRHTARSRSTDVPRRPLLQRPEAEAPIRARSTEVARARERPDPPSLAPATRRPRPEGRRHEGRLRGGLLTSTRSHRRDPHWPEPTRSRAVRQLRSPSTRPRPRVVERNRYTRRRWLVRPRESREVQPSQHADHPHRSANGAHAHSSEPESPRAPPEGHGPLPRRQRRPGQTNLPRAATRANAGPSGSPEEAWTGTQPDRPERWTSRVSRRSAEASLRAGGGREPKPLPRLLRRPTTEVIGRTKRTPHPDRRPKAPAGSTGRFVQRAASCLLTRLQPQPFRAGRAARRSEPIGPRPRSDRGRLECAATASDPSRGSIADGAQQQIGCTTCSLPSGAPEGATRRETARSEGTTTPPMGFGAFRRNQSG